MLSHINVMLDKFQNRTPSTDINYYNHVSDVGSSWLSDFAHHGRVYGKYGPQMMDVSICDKIFKFMDKYNIGKSEYGKLMDLAGREKGVFLHRLYGHHLVYDFPFSQPEHIIDFLEHEFSDLFTKNGLPIIPGELLENAPGWLKKLSITNEPCKSWNFINGFDLLAGTIAIFTASRDLRSAILNKMSVESLGDFAKTIGVGIFELAVAMSTANPLLLIGSIIELTAGIKGIFNDGDIIYMEKQQHSLSLKFALQNSNLESALKALSIDNSLRETSITTSQAQTNRFSFE